MRVNTKQTMNTRRTNNKSFEEAINNAPQRVATPLPPLNFSQGVKI